MGGSGDSRTEALVGTDHVLVQQFQLEVVAGPDAGHRFTSAGDRVVIGSHQSSDLVLTDPSVSRFHCEIAIRDGRAHLRDLGSRNGTQIGGVSIVECVLDGPVTLTLGRSQLAFGLSADRVRLPLAQREQFGLLVGVSPVIRAVFAVLERAAKTDATVLLQGETGTGKDAAAESIHMESARSDGPFVVVDCGAISPNLIESELFGHEKGAFTGAEQTRQGAFELASGGTLFLDEIGELSLELQPKLLRALEHLEVQRIGGDRRISVDVRVIAATNRNLRTEVNAKRFRSDLYYRLAVLEILIPPLRDHTEDLPVLVDHLARGISIADDAVKRRVLTDAFRDALRGHPWPGNVRELRNYLERCLAMETQLPLAGAPVGPPSASNVPDIDVDEPLRIGRDRWIHYFEREYIQKLLAKTDNNVTAAAKAAGIDRAHLYRLMFRCGLKQRDD